MSSLLRMSDDELTRRASSGDGLRMLAAVCLATAATILALLGLAGRFGSEESRWLPGLEHPAGLAAWAVVLGGMVLLAGILAESVVVRRLQKAVAVSLAIHLLLCLFSLLVHLSGIPIAETPAEEAGAVSLSEMTVPDYGAMEAPNADSPDFNAPTQVDLSANSAAQLDRQTTEVDAQAAPQNVDVEQSRDVAQLQNLQRQTQEAMQQDAPMQIERQSRPQTTDAPQAVSNPQVSTQSAQQVELSAREAERAAAALAQTQREMSEVRSPNQTQAEASRIEIERSQSRPSEMNDAAAGAAGSPSRAAAQAAAANAAAQSVEVATQAVEQPTLEQRRVELQRQAAASATAAQSPMTDSPTVEQSLAARQVAVQKSQRAESTPAAATPQSVAAPQFQRSQSTAENNPRASAAPAESVSVAAAANAASADLSAQQAASTVTRSATGTAAPTGAATSANNAPSVRRSASGAQALAGSSISRNGSSGSQPALGSAASGGSASGAARSNGSTAATAGAVGSRAEGVSVTAAGNSAADGGQLLVDGPSGGSSRVSRNRAALPSTGGTSGGGTAAGGGSQAETGLAMTTGSSGTSGSGVRGVGTSGLAGRGAGPAATLGNSVPAGSGLSGSGTSGRRGPTADLPSGLLTAEQSGALVIAGPQAAPSGVGGGGTGNAIGLAGLSGPRSTSVGRRSAGLPGSQPAGSVGRSAPSLPGSLSAGRISIGAASGGTGSQPTIAGASEIAGLMRRAAPSLGAVNADASSAGFSMRRPDVRREAAEKLGGNKESEDAVERGLDWLARHQYAAGNWSIHSLNCGDECSGHGSFHSDTAATGLALLAYFGAGYTHTSGEHQDVVRRGLGWLTSHQKADGDLFTDSSEFVWLYSHGMAAIALCEAYGMTGDESLREPAQRAINFIIAAQHPEFGGWRYRPRFESDTSVSGWQLMALKSGEMAGLNVPQSAYAGVTRWLNSVEEQSTPGRFRYHPTKETSLAMTAEGLLMRQYLGAKRDNPALIAGADYLRSRAPRIDERDAYYWYYATQVMFHMQGEYWSDWNAKLRDLLITGQLKDGHSAGSWNPSQPATEKWGEAGGRHYLTCLNLLMLEVYYRHLPLYIELDR
jgi:hypothetical protein